VAIFTQKEKDFLADLMADCEEEEDEEDEEQ